MEVIQKLRESREKPFDLTVPIKWFERQTKAHAQKTRTMHIKIPRMDVRIEVRFRYRSDRRRLDQLNGFELEVIDFGRHDPDVGDEREFLAKVIEAIIQVFPLGVTGCGDRRNTHVTPFFGDAVPRKR